MREDPFMLHARVVAPTPLCDAALARLRDDPTVTNVLAFRAASVDGDLDLVQFDIARENAHAVLRDLRRLGLDEQGSISIDAPDFVLSRSSRAAERAAPGHPSDGVVWDQIEANARDDVRMSWTFLVFLVLATMIAGVGRYLDQPILIIGAMVVGPEFAPVAAICFGLARRRYSLVPTGVATLATGFAVAAAVSVVFWLAARAVGAVSYEQATTGDLTQFIIEPDGWSLVIALLAGAAGVLSMTASKSAALVGVFISVTTVPAVGTVALTVAVGAWGEAGQSLLQLGVNLAGMVIAGTATLFVQSLVWRRTGSPSGQGDQARDDDLRGPHDATP